MKLSRIWLPIGLLLVLVAVALSPISLQASEPVSIPAAPDYQLLTNPGVEVYDPPYGQYEGVDLQVATGWERFWYGGSRPYWMDTRVFAHSHLGDGWVDRIQGKTSQLVFSAEPYAAGIRQQVGGLTPGVGYGFHAAMLTIYQTSAQPPVDGKMIKQVGIDPTGGTDPEALTVVWSESDDHDQGPWSIDLRTAVYATSPTMTVFIHVISPHSAGPPPFLNLSFLDSAILARTPEVMATSPAVTVVPTFTVNWDNAVPAPGGDLRGCDVQWMDEAEGIWHDWFTQTDEVESIFVGEQGHAYRFRARAWQLYANGAHLYGPYRPDGDSRTYFQGPRLTGWVLNNEGDPVGRATVAISGTTYATTSGSGGWYELDVQAWPDPHTATVSDPIWLAPAPVHGLTFGPTETVTLTWTLRPPDDAVLNGGFEAGLDGWSLAAAQGVTPTVVTEPVHTGVGSLSLGGAAPVSFTIGVSQAVILADAWEPALSFWYRPLTTDTDDLFNVVLTVVTQTISATLPVTPAAGLVPSTGPITTTLPVTTVHVFTPPLDLEGWQHLWYYPGLPHAALTGTVTVQFQLWEDGDEAATTVYLDEVSLGSTSGGPYGIYLPLVLKGCCDS